MRQRASTNPTVIAKLSNKPSHTLVLPKTNTRQKLEEMDIEQPDLPDDAIPSDLKQNQPQPPPTRFSALGGSLFFQ